MSTRLGEERQLLLTTFPQIEWSEDGTWGRIANYIVPPGPWRETVTEVTFRLPPGLPGEAPYAFFVRPLLTPTTPGASITNFTENASTPFGEGWGQFSWAPEDWVPDAVITRGSNMLNFARSFAERLGEGP